MNRRYGLWISCLVLISALWWQASACGPTEVKPGENGGEVGTTKDAGGQDTPKVDTPSPDKGTPDITGSQETTPDTPSPDKGGPETPVVDAGPDTPNPDLSVIDTPPVQPITMVFNPKSGETIDLKDFCINVTFSQAPSKKGWSAKWQIKGQTEQVPSLLAFDSNDNTKATLCALVYLAQKTTYEIELTVKDASQTTLSTEKATYTTKDTFANETPANAGITTNMTLSQLVSPAGLVVLLGGLQPDQLVPILAHLYTKDTGQSGKLTYIGAAGVKPPGGKPHQGMDIVDNNAPSSALMKGTFSGRLFSVSSPRFFFAAGNLSLDLEQFQLTGITSADGKRIDEGSFTAIVDAKPVQKQIGVDICALLVGECFVGPNGRDLIRFAGRLKGVANPLQFSAFLPTPQRLNTNISVSPVVELYFTEAITAASDLTFKWETCKGSTDVEKPCDTTQGATRAVITVAGTPTLGANKTSATLTPTTPLPAATWVRLEVTAKNASNQSTTTFTLFQTK